MNILNKKILKNLNFRGTCALFSLILLSGCAKSLIEVHTDYITEESLASYVIGTPDPLLNNPPFGQRLIISWSVPAALLQEPDPHLLVTIRYRNRQEVQLHLKLNKRSGTYIHTLFNQEYCATRGILTYKADLIAGGSIWEAWRHQLWADLILFEESTPKEEEIIWE